jgi:FlaA1/EpsC-like NDP-sugar epimerase
MRPVAFIDDDHIADRSIAGLQVYKPKHIQQMIDETGAQEILLALPSSTRARRREILTLLERFPCTSVAFQTSPTWPAAG